MTGEWDGISGMLVLETEFSSHIGVIFIGKSSLNYIPYKFALKKSARSVYAYVK